MGAAILLLIAALGPVALAGAAERPNVVLVLADDMGYGDVRAFNPSSRIPTPSLDRLAGEGMSFTDAHTPSSVCTPTRYGLLTGRYAWRGTLKRGVLDGYNEPLIEPGRPTASAVMTHRSQGKARGSTPRSLWPGSWCRSQTLDATSCATTEPTRTGPGDSAERPKKSSRPTTRACPHKSPSWHRRNGRR